jgi:tetratricopeptide (TPR) repeat protein
MPKKAQRRRKKRATSAGSVELDPETIETLLDQIGRLLSDHDLVEALLDADDGVQSDDELDAAQELVDDAWDAPTRRQRIALAKKALAISPLCADAYVILAQEARTVEEALGFYRQGMAAGERALGEVAFEADVGDFWGLFETRPYMRARHGLALTLWRTGEKDEAVAHYQDMLRLNPDDNQGIRYLLLDALLELGRDKDAEKLMKRYKDDGAAVWAWSGALLAFRRKGDGAVSRKALAAAVRTNPHVPAFLFGEKKLPSLLPEYIGRGDESEAVSYVHGAAAAWAAAPGALAWASTVLA